jgi:predicted phage baseplate assembly protein
MPAIGGISEELIEEVRLIAPHAYRRNLERAITAGDYAEIASRNKKIQKAAAALRWTGSWYEAQVAVDPLGTEKLLEALDKEIEGNLHPFRRMGHDVAVITADYVPLSLTLTVCVDPDFLREHVKTALIDCFSNRILPDGKYGFFHPDRLTFGGGIAITSIVATAQAVPGVTCALASLKRFGDKDTKALEDRVLNLGPMEIARLDNDPSFPEHGMLTLVMEGGR